MTTMKATINHGRFREFRVTYNYSGNVWCDLLDIAEDLTFGVHNDRQSNGESDGEFLDRVSEKVRNDFMAQAREATGVDSFSFAASFAD